MSDVWEQQDGETDKQFIAFSHYRDLPPSTRSIDAAYRVSRGESPRGKRRAVSRWFEWSSANHWVERAQAFDREKDRRRVLADFEATQEMVRLHAKAGRELVEKATKALGRLPLNSLNAHQIVALFRAGVEAERRARGLSSDAIDLRVLEPATGGTESDDLVDRLLATPEGIELLDRIEEILASGDESALDEAELDRVLDETVS